MSSLENGGDDQFKSSIILLISLKHGGVIHHGVTLRPSFIYSDGFQQKNRSTNSKKHIPAVIFSGPLKRTGGTTTFSSPREPGKKNGLTFH